MTISDDIHRSSPWSSDQVELSSPSSGSSTATQRQTPPLYWCTGSETSEWIRRECGGSARYALVTHDDLDGVQHCLLRCDRPSVAKVTEAGASAIDYTQLAVAVACIAASVVLVKKIAEIRRQDSQAVLKASHRNEVVDVFRGLTISLMVFVNYGGGGFAAFQHSVWDGLTIADLVFPWFAWIMGVTMRVSRRLQVTWSRALLRAIKLFTIGLFLNNGATWADWRIPGVLQSLGVAYIGVVILSSAVTAIEMRSRIQSGRSFLLHIGCAVAPLVAINLSITYLLHVPGCPTGYVGPGGDDRGGIFRQCTGGAHLYVDKSVFGEAHLFQTPTCREVYHTGAYDPEGLLNWMMVTVTAYAGYLAGGAVSQASPTTTAHTTDTRRFALIGGGFVGASAVLSGIFGLVEKWPTIAVNKNLWSLSYILISIGLAHILFVLLLQVRPHRLAQWIQFPTWAHVGQNSIVVYVMHEMAQSYVPFSAKPSTIHSLSPMHEVLLLHNVAALLWWIYVAEWMHQRGIIVSV